MHKDTQTQLKTCGYMHTHIYTCTHIYAPPKHVDMRTNALKHVSIRTRLENVDTCMHIPKCMVTHIYTKNMWACICISKTHTPQSMQVHAHGPEIQTLVHMAEDTCFYQHTGWSLSNPLPHHEIIHMQCPWLHPSVIHREHPLCAISAFKALRLGPSSLSSRSLPTQGEAP